MASFGTSKGLAAPEVDNSWQAEEDVRTMKRAAEIHRDRKRMKLMHKHAKKEIDGLRKVSKYAKLMQGADEKSEETDVLS